MDIRVGKRAQVVIPLAIRRRMGVHDGDLLHADLDDDGRLILQKVSEDPVDRLIAAGRGLHSGDPVEAQRALRSDDEWARRADA